MMVADEEGEQGDQLMARKLAKQGKRNSLASAMNFQGARVQEQQQQQQPMGRLNVPQAEYQQEAAEARERHMQVRAIDSSKQRQALYGAWPEDRKYLEQQVALLQHELAEKDKQLRRAHTEIKMITCEMEQMRREHDSDLSRVKGENMAQLVRTVQKEGIRGLQNLSRMQSMGKFAEGREKERQKVYELERGVIHDLESMQREYENKLSDMRDEYQVRLNWLTHKQSHLEAEQQTPTHGRYGTPQPQRQARIAPTPSNPARSASRSTSQSASSKVRPYGRTPPQPAMDHKQMTETLAKEYYKRMGY